MDIQPPEESNRLGRATFGLEFYQHQVDSSLDTLVPLATPQNGLLYLNPKLSVSDRLNPSVSIGLGYRHLFEGPQIILGGNLFYDSDYTNFDHHVNQFGFGAEVLSRWVDFRANYYLPEQNRRRINTKQTTSLSQKVTSSTQALGPVATSDTIGFSGHNLVETIHGMNQTLNTFNVTNYQTTHFWEQYEGAMRGVDTELGFLIPGLDKYAETRIFGGYYYYENPFGKNFSGFKGRLEVRALPSVTFDAAYYQDKEIVGSNWYYGVRVSTPFDVGNIAHGKNPFAGFAEGFKPQQTSDAERFAARLSENVIRSSHVATSHSNFIEVGQKTVVVDPPSTFVTGTPFTKTIVLTLDGTPITITHVDSAVAVAGDGSVEHPYMTLTLADTDAVKRAIVLLHAGSTFNSQSITLAPNQMLLGSSTGVTNTVKTDQLGVIKLPNAGNSAAMPTITNPGGTIVNVATNNVIAGLTLTNAARGVAAPSGTTNLVVRNSTISNMTIAGLGLNAAPVTGTTVSNVTFAGNNQDIVINGSNTTIANTTSTGAAHGSIDLVNPSGTTALSNVVINGASDFAVRSTNAAAGSTHNFAGFKATGGAAGIDIEGGAGTFNVDSASTLTNTGGASLLVNGGSANVNFGGNITQAMNAPAVAVLGGHTGTVRLSGGTVAASAGPGLQFNNANGTYQFLGTTKLTGGANLQILNNSAGTFAFSTGASIVNGSGQDILVDNSTASLQYSGSASANSGALLQVNNHSAGTLQFDTGTLSATGGTGLQFNNADGTYKFLGTGTLTGTSAGVALTNGSDGTFQFDTATNITNPTGTAFFVNGGTANITYSGNITANTGFALQVLNHSTGTINFNTGKIDQTAGVGVQFVNDAGTYNLADTRVSNSSGTAVQVTGSPTGTFNFGTVKLVDSAGTAVLLTNGGTVNLLGGTIDGSGGNGILSVNTTLTATGLTLGGNHSKTIAGIGVQVVNNDGTARTVTISNDSIRSNGAGIQSTDGGTAKELTLVLDGNAIETLAGGAPAMSLTGSALNSTIVKSMNGGTVTGNGAGGGLSFNRVTFDASGAALSGTAVNAGTWNIGQGTGANQRVLNDGLHLSAPTGTLNFGTLNIFNNAGTGLFVDTKTLGTTFTLSGGGSGTIDTLGGAAVNIDPLTTNLTFGSVTSTNSSGAGVIVSGLTSGSTLTFNSTHVVNSAGSGVVVLNSNGANINFGTTTVNNAGGSGIDLSGAGGANVTFGTTTVVNPGASGINMSGATGTFIFGDTTINGTAAGQTAFNLNGGNANVTANSLNINGGGIGIDLRNTINGHTVIITNGGDIHNVNVAVQLGGGVTGNYANSANAFFTFDATGGHNSTLSGTVAIEARGLVSTASNVQGTYDFRNVTNIVGAENFEPTAGTPFFVAASAHGTGDGSTPLNAAAYTAIAGTPAGTFIVLVNDGNVINIGASTITLQNNDHVDTFGNGRTFSAGTAPINILLPGVAQFTDPFGNGAATITGTSTLFAAANGDLLQNFTMTLGGVGSTGISATGSNGLTVTNLTINGTGSVFNLNGTTGSVNLINNNINVSGGTLLSVNGGNATVALVAGSGSITNTGGAGINIANTTGGNVTITGVNVTGATSTPLVFDNNKATFNITNSTFATAAGVTLLNVDTGAGGSTTSLVLGASNTLTHTSGTIATIGAGARDIDLSAHNFTNNGTSAANVIKVVGQTGGTISFGSIGINGFTGAGPAISLAGTGGTVNFNNALNITTDLGTGLSATGAITLNASGASNSITTGGGLALSLTGTNIGTVNFNSIEVDDSFSLGTQGAIALNGTSGGTMNVGTLYVERSLVDAVSLQNVASGTYNFNGLLTVNSVGGASHAINIAGAATGSSFNFANIDVTTVPNGDAISLANNNLAQVSFTGGQINRVLTGDAIHSVNTVLTATGLSIGNNVAFAIGGNGIEVINNDGVARTVNLSNDNIRSASDAIKTSDSGVAGELSLILNGNTLATTGAGSLAMNIVGSGTNSTTVNAFNGVTVNANGSGGGILFNRVTFDAVTGGTIQQVTAGAAQIGQGTGAAQRVQGDGLHFDGPTGDLAFTTLNIFNNAGTGLFVDTKTLGTTFSLSNSNGSVDTTNGAAIFLDPLTVNLTFGSTSSTNAPGNAVNIDTVNGTVALGTVNVTNAGAAGIRMVNSGAAVTASSVTVNGAATGLTFGANTGGSFTVSGATSLTGITGTGINGLGAIGTYQFAGLTIGFTGAGRGIDLRNSNVSFTTGNLSITGNGTAGSIGLDLSGSLNPNGANSATPNIVLAHGAGQTATISNVATGVKLGESGNSAGSNLQYGNLTPISSGGSGSTIAVIAGGKTIDTTNLTSSNSLTQGHYDFTGVTFTGSASFEASVNFFFVANGATGTGDGSSVNNRANAATLLAQLGANALANRTIVLINDGTAITLANTAALDANTNITGFGNGNSVVAFSIPVNVVIDAFTGTVTDPTGNGAATLTTAAGHNLISLNGGNSITNVTLSGGDFLISGTNTTTGLTVQGNTLTSGALGVFSFTNATGVINITNNAISGGGRLLDVNGGSAGITLTAGTGSIANTAGSGIQIRNTTGGSVTLTGLNVTGATSTPLTFDNNKATFNITSSTFGVTAGTTLLNVDTVTGGSTTALTFGATDTLIQTSGSIANIGAGARDIDLSAQNFTNTGTTAANVINVTGQTGGTISFGTVGITGYNNVAGTAVNLQGTAGTVSFADLDIATTAGAALNVGAITFNPGSSSTLSSSGTGALIMSGTTAQGGAIGFTGVTSSGGTAGISLTNTIGSFTLANIAISNTTGNGVTLVNAGTVKIDGGSINGAGGNAIDATNSTLNVGSGQLQIGNTSAITGSGIRFNVTDGNAHTLDVFNADIRNVGGLGINVAHSGSGTVTVSVTSTGIASTGTALNVVKGGAGALNFSTATDSFSSTGGLGMNANGTAGGGVLTVTQVGADVTSAASGGMVFNGVVFDANPTTAGIQTVSSVGTEITTNGAGLAISNATGTLVMDTLTIANSGGTGLIVTSAVNFSTNHGSITTTNGAAMDLTNATLGLVFDTPVLAVSSTNSSTNGVFIGAGTSGSVNLGGVSVTGATLAGIQVAGSAANVTTGDITVQNSATGLRFGSNTGTFTATGTTSLTGITGTGINANAATGTYSFQGNTTIGFTGAGRGIDLRSSNLASFQTGNLSITGDSTAGSIAIDLSGSLYPGGQPVTNNAPNIKLATGAGQTAAISAVATGVRLGDGVLGSAGAYLRYGNQTPTNSGSSIAVIAGGTTVDTGNLTSTTPFQQGRYEFTGVIFTGQATFESSSSNFLFVGTNAAGAANGSNPNNRISTATFLASDNTAAFLAGKTIIFVNDDNVNGINLGAATLNLGASTTIAGFGNGASIVVPGGVQPVNVIGDTFVPGGGTFTDAAGAATIHNNAGVNTITLNTGNTLSNFNLGNGGTSIVGTTFGTLTVNGVSINNTTGGAINLTTGTLAGTGFGSVTSTGGTNGISLTGVTGTMNFGSGALSGASGATFNVSGGSATLSYSGTIANATSRTVSVQSMTGGSITLSGAINDTGTGILVQNNTGGTINFTGTGSTLNTGANQAVTLATNTGAAINFSGSNLAITTTSGIGFGASGGGTVGLTGAGSTITTGTGTALSLNGVAIGGSGFILKSVSANGAVNGIALNNLTGGGGAGVQVLGTGATSGSGGTIQNTTGAAVSLTNLGSLNGGVTLDNMNLTSDAGGITGTTFGTLAVANVSVTATGTVGALNLATGAFASGSTFSTLSSSGAATNGVLLNAVTGDFTASAGSISNATGAAWSVVGGTVSTTYSGGITQGNNAALVSITGGHATGTITFQTGTLSATNGTGLQFDNADGTYNFNGTTTLNGGDAGVDILNGSGGTFGFGTGVTITSPSGTAFNVNGSTANVTYSGNITYATAGQAMVNITNEASGTITFQTGTLSATNGTGIVLNNADGTVNFNGTTTLNGGNAHVDINTGSGGTFTFGSNTSITSPTGAAFVFNGSTAGVTYNGNITQATAGQAMVSVTSQTSGTILFQTGTLSATNGTGINLNNADGTVTFSGTTTLNGGNAHVDINTGSGGTFTFGSNTSITSPTGAAFVFNGSTAGVTYSGNITQATAGQAMVDITGQASGTITFQTGTLSATNGTGINLNNVDGTVNFSGTTTLNGGNAHIDINTGSSGTITFSTGTSVGATTAPTGTAYREDTSTATVNYNGTLRQTNAASVVTINAKTGGTTTFAGAITASTSTANAIDLTSNTGGTIAFTGGLSLTTTTGTGFNATGGGTVTATQNNGAIVNTISSSGGTALQISNTTIGAANVTFRSISSGSVSSSAGTGIILDTTGASGGLVVTGNGGAGTGGTIQHKTGADGSTTNGVGIYLNSTKNVSLAWMQLNDFDNYGILGNNVTGFTLTNTVVNGTNGTNVSGVGEGDVYFTGLIGSATVSNSTFTGAAYDAFHVFNNGGQTLNRITITGSTFATNSAAGNLSNDALVFQATDGTFNATVQSSTFTSARGDLFQLDLHGGVTSDLVFGGGTALLGNTLSNNNQNILSGGGGVTISSGGAGDHATLTFNVAHNTMRDALGTALGISSGSGTGSFTGTIDSNTIGVAGVANSGSVQGNDIGFVTMGGAASSVTISNNTLFQYGNGAAILVQTGDHVNGGNSQLTAVVIGNTVSNPGSFGTNGFLLTAGTVSGDAQTVSLTLGGTGANSNHFAGSGFGGATDIRLRDRFDVKVGLHAVGSPNYAGAATDAAAVTTYVQANNTGSPTVSITTGNVGTSGFFGTPLLLAPGGTAASGSNAVLDQAALNALGNAAISLWNSTGLTAQQTALLQGITFSLGELPTGYVGEALPGQIILSNTAAGQSWYIDSTPLDNSEFTGSGSKLTAIVGGPAAGRVDAFTVILHEVGHELGLDDTYLSSASSNLMYGYISLGERRLPVANQAFGVAAPVGSFADALQLGSPSLTPPGSSAWKPSVIIHAPVAPTTFVLPKNVHSTIERPAQSTNAREYWIMPAFGSPTTIYLPPALQPADSKTLEIDPSVVQPHAQSGASTQNEADQPTPLSSTNSGDGAKATAETKLPNAFRAPFMTGTLPLAKHQP